VTFEHRNPGDNVDYLPAGNPHNPRNLRIRTDLKWEEVVSDFFRSVPSGSVNEVYGVPVFRHYDLDEKRQYKTLLENYALSKSLNPYNPATWHSMSRMEMKQHLPLKVLQPIFDRHGYVQTLMSLFPSIGLDEKKFVQVSRAYFTDVKTRKSYFDAFAKKKGFDPLVADNWYKTQAKDLHKSKTRTVIHRYYHGNFGKAISHLYPDINFDQDKLARKGRRNRKEFFDSFAKESGFDPLAAHHWYRVTEAQIWSKQYAHSVLLFYDCDFRKALVSVYPNIGLHVDRFLKEPAAAGTKYWDDAKNRKKFFDDFAWHYGFDALVPDHWYMVSTEVVLKTENVGAVLKYYRGKMEAALAHLYPNIGLDVSKFSVFPCGYFMDKANQKKIFDYFAQRSGFDPLIATNWYQVSPSKMYSVKGIRSIVNTHYGSLPKALLGVYPNIGLKR